MRTDALLGNRPRRPGGLLTFDLATAIPHEQVELEWFHGTNRQLHIEKLLVPGRQSNHPGAASTLRAILNQAGWTVDQFLAA
jgi:hypothetical protein